MSRPKSDFDALRIEEAGTAARGLHVVAGELMLENLDLVVERSEMKETLARCLRHLL